MPVIANLLKPRGLGKRKLEILTATGPAADVTIAAGAAGDIAISISPELATKELVGCVSLGNLPDAELNLLGFKTSATAVTLRVYNPTTAGITVSAGSIEVKVLVIGY